MTTTPDQPEQLVFDLPHRSAMDAEDFMVSDCNKAALAAIDMWPKWPAHTLLLVGAEGSGKSHLAQVWRVKSQAKIICLSNLPQEIENFSKETSVIVEDIDVQTHEHETALFHILNLAKEHDFSVLMTARRRPGSWVIQLPDLRSRLRAMPFVEIDPPDAMLLDAILVKLFQDRQLTVAPHVIRYMSLHMERSVAAAQRLVAAIDKAALSKGRKVTRQLVSEVLADFN